MKPKKILFFVAAAFIGLSLVSALTSFKSREKPCEVTIQFSPTTGNFAFVSVDNCNSSASSSSVTAGTNWIPILPGAGCTTVGITTSLPAIHPAGTIRIYKNGVLLISHAVAQNQDIYYDDIIKADCDDYFMVTW